MDTDKYEILKVIGRGGSSVVYLARHKVMGNVRVIKKLCKSAANAECYFVELNILSRLKINGAPQIYDVDEDNDNWYIIEEYISGITFEEYIESDERTIEELLGVIYDICDILTELHGIKPVGIVYNDLKPENMIVSDRGLYLLDFGNCELMDGFRNSDRISASNISPEHVTGERLAVQTDVYGIGVLIQRIYQLRSELFRSSGILPRGEIIFEDIIKEVISGCMEKNISDRFSTPDMVKKYIFDNYERIVASSERERTMLSKLSNISFNSKGKLCGKYRNAKVENIYVYGSRRYAGVTHFAIGYAGYLSSLGKNTAYIEHDNIATNVMTDVLDKAGKEVMYRQGRYIYKKCVMCPDYMDFISEGIGKGKADFDINIHDCGLYSEDQLQGQDYKAEPCEEKVIVVITDIKSYGKYDELFKDYLKNKSSNNILYIVNFSDEQGYKRFVRNTGQKAIWMPLFNNPFERNKEVREFYAKVQRMLLR